MKSGIKFINSIMKSVQTCTETRAILIAMAILSILIILKMSFTKTMFVFFSYYYKKMLWAYFQRKDANVYIGEYIESYHDQLNPY